MNSQHRLTFTAILIAIITIATLCYFEKEFVALIAFFISVLLLSLPMYFKSNVYTQERLKRFEMECTIISTLRMANLSFSEENGWITKGSLYISVKNALKDEFQNELFLLALEHLVQVHAVHHREILIEQNEKENVFNGGYVHIYKHNQDSNYKPKKPGRVGGEKEIQGHADAYS